MTPPLLRPRLAIGLAFVLAACAPAVAPPPSNAATAAPSASVAGPPAVAGPGAPGPQASAAPPAAAPPPDSTAQAQGATAGGAPSDAAPIDRYQVPVGASPSRGPATALVTIVEFADYECPFCARVEDTLRELRTRYGDTIRIVFKDAPLPFHPHAEPAAEAAREVRAEKGDAAFWAMHDALFDHARDLGTDALAKYAEGAGARADKVRAAIAKQTYASAIEADADVADDFGAEGTPFFFVNGRPIAGAEPASAFVPIIDAEAAAAKRLLASGVAPDALYDAVVKDAQKPPEPEKRDVAGLPAGDPSRGPANARVTVHEFADFQCPFCVRAEPALQKVAAAYADRVRFVWHDLPLPFHANAKPAARAGRQAQRQGGDRAFWKLHDRLLVLGARLSRADLDDDARSIGLDMTRWASGVDSPANDDAIDADRRAAEAIDLHGTPSFLVAPAGSTTGYLLVGAQSYAKFRKLVERALGEAR